jgi:hypothetical protein
VRRKESLVGSSRSGIVRRAAVVAVAVATAVSCSSSTVSHAVPTSVSPAVALTTTASTSTTVPPPLVAALAAWKLDQPWSRAVVLDDNGQLLVFSGLDAAKRSLSRVVRINPGTGQLTAGPKLPRVVHDAAGTMLGTVALLIGGGEQETGYDNVTAVTGPRTGSDIGRLPQPRSDLAAIAVGSTAYVIGGYDGKNLLAAVLATDDGAAFATVGQLDPAVRYPAVASTGGILYVFGGKVAVGQTDAIQRFDPATGTLRIVGHLPMPTGHAMAFVLGGTVYVAGGRVGNGDSDSANRVSADVWAFDPSSGKVDLAGMLPYPVADAGVAVVGDQAYIVGGETNSADAATSSVIVLHR